jgi:predicted phosphodiesterase
MTGGTQVRIAAVSDIHGNLPALEAVVADIARHHVDQVVNLGDCLSGPLWPAETADWLIELGWPTLAGNHERQMLGPGAATLDNGDGFAASSISAAHRDWLKGLPPAMTLGDDLFLCHGTPDNDDGYWLHRGRPGAMRKATPDEIIPHATSHGLALCGHTHVSRRVILGDGRMIANPGSVGLPAFDDHDLVPDPYGADHPTSLLPDRRIERGRMAGDVADGRVRHRACRAPRRGQWPVRLGLYTQDRKAPAVIFTHMYCIYKRY